MYHPFPKDREEQTAWASSLLARADWVVLDTETTGLDDKAEVVQVAVLALDGSELLNRLVRPVGEISPGVQAVHGLRKEILQNAPAFAELSLILQTILSGKEVVVYNAAYDFRILWQFCLAAGISPTWLHGCGWTCAMERYAAWHGEWNDYYFKQAMRIVFDDLLPAWNYRAIHITLVSANSG
jgi:DNA polymerase-3 subunit epsilon